MSTTYYGIFGKGSDSAIQQSSIQNGHIKVATDAEKMYVEFSDTGRLDLSSVIRDYTSSEITGGDIESPLTGKLYVASDTGHIYVVVDGSFVDVTNLKVSSAFAADSATYATSAGSATTAAMASSATYATSAGSAGSATTAASATNATNATNASNDANGNSISATYAPIASPTFTGTPAAPTPASSSNNTTVATTAFVHAVVSTAIGGIISFHRQKVSVLPTEDIDPYCIYFLDNGDQTCTEYMYIDNQWEILGTTAIVEGLTGATVSGSGNAITGATVTQAGVLQLTKDSTFLTAHPTITMGTDTTPTSTVDIGSTFTAITNITKDSNGHVTAKETKTYTIGKPDAITKSGSDWYFDFGTLDSGL